MNKIIHTLGSSNRSSEEFIALLRSFGIEMVADIRSYPVNRFPQFRREVLAQNLGGAGIGYVYLGKELGGYRKGEFEAYTQTYEYLQAIERLERLSSRCRSAILCAERLPQRCHRRFIAKSLEERGWKVVHIIEAEQTWEPPKGSNRKEEE